MIPLEQIGYLQDDYQPASYERSPSTKVRGSKASIPPPNGTAAVGGGAEAGEWEEDDRVEEGFQQDDYSAQDGGGYSCKSFSLVPSGWIRTKISVLMCLLRNSF